MNSFVCVFFLIIIFNIFFLKNINIFFFIFIMLINDNILQTKSPLKTSGNNKIFYTPQPNSHFYRNDSRVDQIKESYYLKIGRDKSLNSYNNKENFENGNPKYNEKMKNIIERRKKIQNNELEIPDFNYSKQITPEKIQAAPVIINEFLQNNKDSLKNEDLLKTEEKKTIKVKPEKTISPSKTNKKEEDKSAAIKKKFLCNLKETMHQNSLLTKKNSFNNEINEICSDGNLYYEMKSKGLMNRKGLFIDKNKQIYYGEFNKGKKEGFGILKDENKNVIYEGEWKSNKYNGKGKLFNHKEQFSTRLFNYRNMDTVENNWVYYEGEFSNGLFNGYGIWMLNNGKFYEGEFKSGYVHGHGFIFENTKKGKKIEGEWRLNIYVMNLLNNK